MVVTEYLCVLSLQDRNVARIEIREKEGKNGLHKASAVVEALDFILRGQGLFFFPQSITQLHLPFGETVKLK